MSLGNLSAHFAGYQPATQQSREFCEDMPDVAESVFAIDFIHDVLQQMQVEFRIVRDVNGVGLSASWDDVQAIEQLQQATVHYVPASYYPGGSMNIEHTFKQKGTYIGVIVATDPHSSKVYRAVFPFRVGAKDFWDYLPYFVLLIVALEVFYWAGSGGWGRFKSGKTQRELQELRQAV